MVKEVRAIDIARKNVVICISNDSIPTVARKMLDSWVSSVLVVNDNEELIGIITDGIIFKLIADGRNPTVLLARDIMVNPVYTVHQDANILDIEDKFLKTPVKRLAVVNSEDKLVGVLSKKVLDRITKYSIAQRILDRRRGIYHFRKKKEF